MAHSIILIRSKLDAMKGNATSGALVGLRTAVDGGQQFLDHPETVNVSTDLDGIHEQLEQLQAFLADGVTMSAGAADTVDSYATAITALF